MEFRVTVESVLIKCFSFSFSSNSDFIMSSLNIFISSLYLIIFSFNSSICFNLMMFSISNWLFSIFSIVISIIYYYGNVFLNLIISAFKHLF